MTFFAENHTNRVVSWLHNYSIPASYFQLINSLAILLFAPLIAWIWTKLGDKGKEPSSPLKMSFGLFFLSIGYLIFEIGAGKADRGTLVSPMWLTGIYLLHTIGELCLSPIGLSLVNKLAPAKFASLLMGYGCWQMRLLTGLQECSVSCILSRVLQLTF